MATIQGVYVALFGRPADPTGLAYFNGVTNNGADLSAIGDLAATAEYQKKYEGQNNVQIVTAIYQQLFNRNPEAAGLNFFVNALNNGTLNINNIAIAILDGAQGGDKTVVEAKIASANLFTAAIDTPVEDASYRGDAAAASARAWLATIGATAATQAQAEAALQSIVDGNFVGNTVEFDAATTEVSNSFSDAVDDVVTTTKNDTIEAGTFWDGTQLVDGGLGTDTFNAELDAAAIVVVEDGLKNIEIVNIVATGGNGASSVDVEEALQLQQIWNAGSDDDLTVTNVAAGVTVGLSGVNSGATEFALADDSADDDVIAVALNTATGAGGLTIAGVETINISNTGNSNIGDLIAVDATSITVSGSGKFSAVITGSIALESFVGSDGADEITTGTGALTADLVVSTGAGNDSIAIGGGASGFALSITGGAGSDKFVLAAAVDNIDDASEEEFEASLVTITDFSASADVLDFSAALVGLTAASFDNQQLDNISSAASLFDAVTTVEAELGGDDYALFVYDGDAYLFVSEGTAGFGAGDGLVKITGLADLDLLVQGTNFYA